MYLTLSTLFLKVYEEKQVHLDPLVKKEIKENLAKKDQVDHLETREKLDPMVHMDLKGIKGQEENRENKECASVVI